MDRDSRYFWAALLLMLPLLIVGQNHGLWNRSEVREVEVGREMYLSGNFAAPHLNGKPFLEKPPLMPALTALAFDAAGKVSEPIARVPSTIMAFAMLLGIMLLARRIGGWRVGVWAGLITASTYQFFIYSHQSSLDLALATGVTFTMLFFIRTYEPGKTEYSYRALLPFYLFAVFAFYAKGFIGLVFPGLAVVALLAVNRDWRALWRLKPWFGAIVFIALTLPWFIALWRQGGTEYLKVFFIDNHLDRFFKTAQSHLGHQHDPWYEYFLTIWKHFRPWSYLMPFAAVTAVRRLRERHATSLAVRELACWFFTGLLFLTLSSTKRENYLLPVLPPMVVLVAMFMEERRLFSLELKTERWFDWGVGAALAVSAVALPVWMARQPAGSPWALTLIAPALAAVAGGIWFLARKRRARFYAAIWAAGWVLTLACSIFFIPIFSSVEDRSAFTRSIAPLTADARFYYSPRIYENKSGYVGFYTGKTIRRLKKKNLDLLARSQDPVYILMMKSPPKKVRAFESKLQQRGVNLELLRQDLDDDGAALWKIVPSGSATTVGNNDFRGQKPRMNPLPDPISNITKR